MRPDHRDRALGDFSELNDGVFDIAFHVKYEPSTILIQQLGEQGLHDAGGFSGSNAAEDQDVLSGFFSTQDNFLVRRQSGWMPGAR